MPTLVPAPTGPYPIGRVTVHVVDEARVDTLAPEPCAREVMASVWYPAASPSGERASYIEPDLVDVFAPALDLPEAAFERLRSHACEGAAPRAADGRAPVIVFSHGGGLWRNASSLLVEDLASHGYVVVTVDHAYDALAVTFPDGRIVKARPLVMPRSLNLAQWDEWSPLYLAARVADVRHVLDVFAGAQSGGAGAHALAEPVRAVIDACDLRRVGMFGHSLGGSTTAETIRVDDRMCAGAMLDSPLPLASRATPIRVPLLLVQCDTAFPAAFIDESWGVASEHIEGWNCRLRLSEGTHSDFSDVPFIARFASGVHAGSPLVDMQRALLRSFFSINLREASVSP